MNGIHLFTPLTMTLHTILLLKTTTQKLSGTFVLLLLPSKSFGYLQSTIIAKLSLSLPIQTLGVITLLADICPLVDF